MKKNILIIENDEAIRLACEQAISFWGHEVHCANDGSEGLQKLRENEGRFDLILLDSMMPKMTGEQFLEALEAHAEWNRIPVVVMSALNELPARLAARPVLRKPMDLRDLMGVID